MAPFLFEQELLSGPAGSIMKMILKPELFNVAFRAPIGNEVEKRHADIRFERILKPSPGKS